MVISNENNKYDSYLDGIDIIYYINLERSKDRKKHMNNFFKDSVFHNKKIVRFNAVDYKKVNVYNKFTTNSEANINRVSKQEYACLLSHLEVIRKFSKTNYQHALILEDDVEFIDKKYWNDSIQNIIDNAPKDYDIIKLYRSCNQKLQFKNMYTFWEVKKNGIIINTADWGNVAYVISNKAAKKLMDKIYVNGKFVLNDNLIHVSDYLIHKELITYTYKYPFFTVDNIIDDNLPSTIKTYLGKYQKTRKKYYKKIFNKNKTCKFFDYKKFK